jgi:hypothetical protein
VLRQLFSVPPRAAVVLSFAMFIMNDGNETIPVPDTLSVTGIVNQHVRVDIMRFTAMPMLAVWRQADVAAQFVHQNRRARRTRCSLRRTRVDVTSARLCWWHVLALRFAVRLATVGYRSNFAVDNVTIVVQCSAATATTACLPSIQT